MCNFMWENTLVLDWWCVGLIYTFYSGRLAVTAGSDQKHFHPVFHRLISPFHFEDKMASFLSALLFLPSIFHYAALLLAADSKQRGQALPSSSHDVNVETFEAAAAYGFDTRQGVRSLIYNRLIINNDSQKHNYICKYSRSQWPCGLRRRSSAARLLRSWVRIPPKAWMFVLWVLCVVR